MPKLRGLAVLENKERSSGGRAADAFTPLLSMKTGEESFIGFITPIEDVEEVWLHTFVKVPNPNFKNGYGFEVFASRTRNEEFNDTYSILEDKVENGGLDHFPAKKVAAIVVDLEPVYEGGESLRNIKRFDVIGREYEKDDGTKVFYPQWKLVFEAKTTFWAEALFVYEDNDTINGSAIRIKKGEKGAWNFKEVNAPIYLNGTEIKLDDPELVSRVPKVSDEIMRLGSKERYEHYFGDGAEKLPQEQKFRPPVYFRENPDAVNPNDGFTESKPAAKSVGSESKTKVSFNELDNLLEDSEAGSTNAETEENDTY